MAKKLGNDYRIWVSDAAGTTWAEVKGGQNLSISRAGNLIDTTTKDNFPYGTGAPGSKTLTLSATFIPDLPDANGYERVASVSRATTASTIGVQVRKGGPSGADPADVVFECEMYVTGDDNDFNQNAAVGASFTFSAAEAPTVDELA